MPAKMRKQRADRLLTDRGLAESREQARLLIMEGLVFAPAGRVLKASALLPDAAPLEVRGRLPYVSRGGVKLAYALDVFGLTVAGLTALDLGASTGGFTDCLLQRGAARVYAVDVGRGQLHQRLRQDQRVVSLERCNGHYPFSLPEPVALAVVDVSFISLTQVLPQVMAHLEPGSFIAALVKPQFEAERGQVGRGGVVRNPQIHAAALGRAIAGAVGCGLRVRNLCPSPLRGDKGNREFFLLLQQPAAPLNRNESRQWAGPAAGRPPQPAAPFNQKRDPAR